MLDVYLILEGKLEFPSIWLWYLVSHWIDQEKLSGLYTNSFIVYCYVLGHGAPCHTCAHAATRTGPGSGSGDARPRPADTLATPFKGCLNLLHFGSPFYFDLRS